jgi:hypothetical protein
LGSETELYVETPAKDLIVIQRKANGRPNAGMLSACGSTQNICIYFDAKAITLARSRKG